MITQTRTHDEPPPPPNHELRFASLHHPGRAVAVPCDAHGRVDLDALPQRMLITYLGARAMLGREYAFPVVQHAH